MTFQSPSTEWRGRLAQLVGQVQAQKPAHGERAGTLKCICGAPFHFTIQSTGISRGHCAAGCGARWCH